MAIVGLAGCNQEPGVADIDEQQQQSTPATPSGDLSGDNEAYTSRTPGETTDPYSDDSMQQQASEMQQQATDRFSEDPTQSDQSDIAGSTTSGAGSDVAAAFESVDQDADGAITEDEWSDAPGMTQPFSEVDEDADGDVTVAEFTKIEKPVTADPSAQMPQEEEAE